MRSKFFVTGLMLLWGLESWAAIDLLSPTYEWNPLPYDGQDVFSDYILDTQASSEDLDLVGFESQVAVYTRYDPADSLLAFRVRVAGDKNPSGFKGNLWIGTDVNQDGNLDVFIGTNASEITLNYGSDSENTTPGNTSVDVKTPYMTTPVTSGNFIWTPVTSSNDPFGPYTDIDGSLNANSNSGVDYFLSFSINMNEFVAAVNNLSYMTGFTKSSSIAFAVGTGTQQNNMNADISGIHGSTSVDIPWSNLGALTPEINMAGGAIPEPGTTALFVAGLSFLFLVVRKRRS